MSHSYTYERRYRGRLRAALLDWAGTTVDYGCLAPAAVFVDVFAQRGVEITTDEARIPMGAHKRDHIQQISQLPAVARRWREVHGSECGTADVDQMFASFVPQQLGNLADFAELIPGTIETVATMRARGMKIGSTTGYTGEMMELLRAEAKRRGYEPESTVCSTDVPSGRPAPWMCFQNAQNLGVFPMEACVKIGDTLSDVAEGLNAGMWTIGLAKSGNEMGLSEEAVAALPTDELARRLARAYERMYQVGAHFVVDSIADVIPLLDVIEARLAAGERP
ncbi:MAG: phosphonoacetaldehyde hydrolase [Planctomycetales bacterium]|nr:phosphonoacetaldehyde hydrolase [Planctomycetales bacterium]